MNHTRVDVTHYNIIILVLRVRVEDILLYYNDLLLLHILQCTARNNNNTIRDWSTAAIYRRSNIFFRSATTPHIAGDLSKMLLALHGFFGHLFGSARNTFSGVKHTYMNTILSARASQYVKNKHLKIKIKFIFSYYFKKY